MLQVSKSKQDKVHFGTVLFSTKIGSLAASSCVTLITEMSMVKALTLRLCHQSEEHDQVYDVKTKHIKLVANGYVYGFDEGTQGVEDGEEKSISTGYCQIYTVDGKHVATNTLTAGP